MCMFAMRLHCLGCSCTHVCLQRDCDVQAAVATVMAAFASCSITDRLTLPGNATNVTLTGLRAARAYVVIITAHNAVGASGPAVISSVNTGSAQAPSVPQGVAVVRRCSCDQSTCFVFVALHLWYLQWSSLVCCFIVPPCNPVVCCVSRRMPPVWAGWSLWTGQPATAAWS